MNYSELLNKLNQIDKQYKIKTIGQTMLGRKILAVERFLSEDFFTAIFVASVHAREHITTDLVMKFLEDGLFDKISEFNVVVVPMLNPDGVELSYFGLGCVKAENIRQNLIKANHGSLDFRLWKANARGVDINNNFNANFGTNISSNVPASQGFAGEYFESELETKALANYTKKINPFLAVAYHSKGEEIYYNFFQKQKDLERDKLIAEKFAKSTGYIVKNVENVSSGGYKDWCVQSLKIPAITIEVGSDNLAHPITERHLSEIYQRHKTVATDVQFAYNVFRKYR